MTRDFAVKLQYADHQPSGLNEHGIKKFILLDWMKKWELPEELGQLPSVWGTFSGQVQHLGVEEENEGVAEGREDDEGRDEAPVMVVAVVEADGRLDVGDDVRREDQHVEYEELGDQEAVLTERAEPEPHPLVVFDLSCGATIFF